MSSVPPLKRCSTFLRLATSDTASATPEDHGPIMNFAPSPSIASSARRVEVPACVAPSRVMYLIGRPSTLMPRSSSAMRMPRSLSGPTSANAPVWSHRPSTTISFDCARTIAGKPSAAAPAAPSLRRLLRFKLLMSLLLHHVELHLGLADVLHVVALRRLVDAHLAFFPRHFFLLAVGHRALERAALQRAYHAVACLDRSFLARLVGHKIRARLVVAHQVLDARFAGGFLGFL